MPWSTREIAELAGVTLRAVRHYHDVGLLDAPERAENGYKQYGVEHLVRLLRIRRLLALGLSLQEIRELGDLTALDDDELRRLDDDVTTEITRLQRLQEELRRLLDRTELVDLPSTLGATDIDAAGTPSDRQMLVVLSRVLTPEQYAVVAKTVTWMPVTEASQEFEDLPADASEERRADLAARMLPESDAAREHFPEIRRLFGADAAARRVFDTATAEVYNAAQIDVLGRIAALRAAGARSSPRAAARAPTDQASGSTA